VFAHASIRRLKTGRAWDLTQNAEHDGDGEEAMKWKVDRAPREARYSRVLRGIKRFLTQRQRARAGGESVKQSPLSTVDTR
jgi:hypothetical protein